MTRTHLQENWKDSALRPPGLEEYGSAAAGNGSYNAFLRAPNPQQNFRKLLRGREKWRMIRVDGKRLLAWRILLHLSLKSETYRAIARTLDVISRDSAPVFRRRFYWRSKWRAGLGDEA